MAEDLDAETLDFAHQVFDLARNGNAERLVDLASHGLPVDLTNDKGDTLLILAAYHDQPATVRALVDLGADTDRINDNGQTAMGAAVFRQSSESVRILLDAGADPAAGRQSALAVAEFFDLPEMKALLRPRQ